MVSSILGSILRILLILILYGRLLSTYIVGIISSYFIDEGTRAKKPAQAHVARKWQRQALNPGRLVTSIHEQLHLSGVNSFQSAFTHQLPVSGPQSEQLSSSCGRAEVLCTHLPPLRPEGRGCRDFTSTQGLAHGSCGLQSE